MVRRPRPHCAAPRGAADAPQVMRAGRNCGLFVEARASHALPPAPLPPGEGKDALRLARVHPPGEGKDGPRLAGVHPPVPVRSLLPRESAGASSFPSPAGEGGPQGRMRAQSWEKEKTRRIWPGCIRRCQCIPFSLGRRWPAGPDEGAVVGEGRDALRLAGCLRRCQCNPFSLGRRWPAGPDDGAVVGEGKDALRLAACLRRCQRIPFSRGSPREPVLSLLPREKVARRAG